MGVTGAGSDTRVTREEKQLEADRRRKMRRQPLILLGVLNALVLAVGTTAALDLRRLQTPGGTALAWVEAAVFGDCSVYRELSVPDRGTVERRTGMAVCKDLKAATGTARAQAGQIALLPGAAGCCRRTRGNGDLGGPRAPTRGGSDGAGAFAEGRRPLARRAGCRHLPSRRLRVSSGGTRAGWASCGA